VLLGREQRPQGETRVLRPLYDWTLSLAASRHALWALAAVSFVESSVFPIPPDVLLIPMVIAAPHRAFCIAGVCTLASVLGGAAGYLIGAVLMEQVGWPVIQFYGREELVAQFTTTYNQYGAWAVLVAGVTPFPYKVVTILSGATELSFTIFMLSSLIARGLRFFVVAALLWRFGIPIREFIERRLGLMFTAFMVLLLGGFAVLRFV
jgi:membrane protein YqaA with SNARE-associated domain